VHQDNLETLQQKIGYSFGDRGVLIQALTHTSYGHEFLQDRSVALRDNERLEFLGDAVLDVVISDILLESYPDSAEGQLSKIIALEKCIRLGKGETRTQGNEKPSILSGCLEALIAAIYLDGGFQAVYPVVRYLFSPFIAVSENMIAFMDHKTQLQELLQARWKSIPDYRLIATHGPDHAKHFEVEVYLKQNLLARASGKSKKEAEQNAAREAIQSLSV
jgi:ribonuclease-3